MAGESVQGVWPQHPSPQYRKSAGAAPKKGLTSNAVFDEPYPASDRRMEACTIQYEILRRQALEAGEISSGNALEMAFFEYRGLVAWLTYEPPCLSPGARSADLQTVATESAECDLILALADLVLGDRLEEKDDSRD